MGSTAGISQGISRPANIQPSSVGMDTPQLLNERTRLGNQLVEVRNSNDIEARAQHNLSERSASPSNSLNMGLLSSTEGPSSLLSGVPNSTAFNKEESSVQLETPHSVGTVFNEGLNTISGIGHVLNAIPAATGISADTLGKAPLFTGGVALVLGSAAGSFAIYQQSQQINRLEQQKQGVLNSLKGPGSMPEGDNAGSLQSNNTADRQIRRLDGQIQQLRTERMITAGVVGSSVVLGATTVGLAASGSLMAARATGTALGGLGILLSTVGAIKDGQAAITQRKVNEKLKSASETLEAPATEAGELTASLKNVAEHAKTAGKSRERGKWFSMSMNILNGLTGAAGIAFKFLIVGSAAATAGTVLLAAGGALALGAACFGIYKWQQNVKLKNAANAALISTQREPARSVEHNKLIETNKYYALKQFVADLQSNTSEGQKNTILGYFQTALNLSREDAATFYNELKNPDTSASATQLLANALFRGKPIVM
jgi:hypothetical protein